MVARLVSPPSKVMWVKIDGGGGDEVGNSHWRSLQEVSPPKVKIAKLNC